MHSCSCCCFCCCCCSITIWHIFETLITSSILHQILTSRPFLESAGSSPSYDTNQVWACRQLTSPNLSSYLTQPPFSNLTQPLSSKLKVLDENGLQIWAQLPLTYLCNILIYVLHILLGGLVYPLTSPNLPPLFSSKLSITQLSEIGFWFQKWHCNHRSI